MPQSNEEIEQQIQLAMDSLSEQSKPNIAKTAREFAVPVHRLRRRWKGGKSLFQRQPNGRKLSSAQEKALCEYIDYFDARTIIIIRNHHHKLATTGYNVFLNVTPTTMYDGGELLMLKEAPLLTNR
ncbi:hypothetical protein N7455_008543 [Penicillium solitum]|uniref:uncharacterized protein n=1 Tax=Penicillium solitum TaxID=60172 RepID=UPI0032C3E8CD|nr:hypothetical protein N7455_008543 [Penicillium solitum]